MKILLKLTSEEAERVLEALNGPSTTDPILARVYVRLLKVTL